MKIQRASRHKTKQNWLRVIELVNKHHRFGVPMLARRIVLSFQALWVLTHTPYTHKSKDATKIILLTLTGCSVGNLTRVKPSRTISQAESRVDAVKDLSVDGKRKIVT